MTIIKFIQLKKEWENLRVKAKRKDDNLLERKRNLSKNTERDAQTLEKDVKEEKESEEKENKKSKKTDN